MSEDAPKPIKKACTQLIFLLCFFNVLLKAAYSVIAPFLPAEAAAKEVDQALVGVLFCVYSISFAIVSPMVGKLLSRFGRRNFLIMGSFIMFISNFGFVMLHLLPGKTTFMVGFVLLRLLQGVGTG